MALPSWTFDLVNLLNPPDEELICSICQRLLNHPVQTTCKHVFCRSCLLKCIKSNKQCPICGKGLTESVSNLKILIQNIIRKQTTKCSAKGCPEIFLLESCDLHASACIHEMIRCKNIPCEVELMRKDIAAHKSNNCPHVCNSSKECRVIIPCIHLDQDLLKFMDSLKKDTDAVEHRLQEQNTEQRSGIEEIDVEGAQTASSAEVHDEEATSEIDFNLTLHDRQPWIDGQIDIQRSSEFRGMKMHKIGSDPNSPIIIFLPSPSAYL